MCVNLVIWYFSHTVFASNFLYLYMVDEEYDYHLIPYSMCFLYNLKKKEEDQEID